jgi:hypothetical protein
MCITLHYNIQSPPFGMSQALLAERALDILEAHIFLSD